MEDICHYFAVIPQATATDAMAKNLLQAP